MHQNQHGLDFTAASADAVGHYDATVSAYLTFQKDTGLHLKQTLTADPEMAMAQCLRGYFFQLFCNPAVAGKAEQSLNAAKASANKNGATRREKLHIAALEAWCKGDLIGATDRWEDILLEAPRDTLALRLAHFTHFYFGRGDAMRDSVARTLYAWDDSQPDYGRVLGLYAFGLEESGDYAKAEEFGRRAVADNPADIWSVHAVAHVMEMQGRRSDGIEWLNGLESSWSTANNFAYHVWWHRSLYHLELQQYDRVLELYDSHIRGDQDSDDYLDMSNGAAMLWRLEANGVDVGDRWQELADKSERRTEDHLLVFADAHFVLALAADGKFDAAARMLETMRGATDDTTTEGPIFANVGLPLCEAILALAQGEHGKAVDLILPIRYDIQRIGGSHAQRDLFQQMLITASLKAGRFDLARALLSERTANESASAWSWQRYAEALAALDDTTGAAVAESKARTLLAA